MLRCHQFFSGPAPAAVFSGRNRHREKSVFPGLFALYSLKRSGHMTMKEQILHAIEALPPDAGIEEAIERLHLLYKVDRGISQADAGQKVTQAEARKRMARWLP